MKKNLLTNPKIKKSFITILLVTALFGKTHASYFWQVSSIISFTGSASYGQGAIANPLVLSIQQCAGGISQPHNSTIYNQTLYMNTLNSIVGGTVVSANAISTPFVFSPNYSYTPSTATVGTLYYYYILTAPSMTTCGFTSTLTSSIATVVVNAVVPAEALNILNGSDYVTLPSAISTSSLVGGNKITVEAWVNPASISAGGHVIVGNYNNNLNQLQFLLRRDNNFYNFSVGTGVGAIYTNLGSAVGTATAGVWQHVAGVYDGTVMSTYINGVLSTTMAAGHIFAATTNSINIGTNTINENYGGNIDEMRIWNVARTLCQINTYMNCEIPSSSAGLITNYHFNQGIAANANPTVTSLSDASGNNFTGTLTAFALTGTVSNWVAPGGVVSGFTTSLAPPSVSATSNNTLLCAGQTATLTASGAPTFSWVPGGPGASIVVSPTVTSNYTVTGTNTIGCTNSSVFTQSVQTCVGINQISLSSSPINVYPNPFKNKINIITNGTKQVVQIFNTLGSLVFNSLIETEKTEIDLSQQPSGVYFIRMGSISKKIVKE